jgi:hypothetical protein
MEYEKPELTELITESDVEQKFLYPLLAASLPNGFGFRSGSIITKVNIRRFEIDKGTHKKTYFPDYVLTFGGVPLAVIEGKAPGADLSEAYREARLYASELNSIYPSGINPIFAVCATNAHELWLGQPDHSSPKITLHFVDIDPYSAKFAAAQDFMGVEALRSRFATLSQALRPSRYFKPRRMIGGLAVQQEEVGHNSFGATLAAELGHIFNPVTRQDRLRIARDGYVSSPRRERYVDPIDRVIRAATPTWQSRSTLIKDPTKPAEFLQPFSNHRELEHRSLLLIGERGAGKTTFLYHLQSVALPKDVRDKTVWVHLDVNTAPVVKNEIYDWTRKELVRGIKQRFEELDFDHIDLIQKIFAVEVNKFNRGLGSLLKEGSDEKNFELYKTLLLFQSDLHLTASCYTRYFGTERDCLVVVVFDNADKKPRDEQLLMFEVAQWLQREFRVLVILPIREETYENHRGEPPLDTALKDLVFRIEPPVFQQALVKRVQIALDEIGTAERNRTYNLPNGFRIVYSETERSYYITSIVASIFEYDSYVRRLIMGLAGNDLRRVFEIFVEFCQSGHIGEGEILRMRQSKGEYVLPLEVVMTVLLRSNRRYYDSDTSMLKNVLDLDEKDERPNYFTRLIILSYLREKFNEAGPSGLKGYFSLQQMYDDLCVYGLGITLIRREVNYLLRAECIVSESLKVADISDYDLIKLGPVGFVHLELLGVAEYWAAVAEDTNFENKQIARRIADRIVERDAHYTPGISLQNGRAVYAYCAEQRLTMAEASAAVLMRSKFLQLTNIEAGDDALSEKSRAVQGGIWFEAAERYSPGSKFEGTVVNVVSSLGLFVELAPGITGLVHNSKLRGNLSGASPQVGDLFWVRVLVVEPSRRRISLAPVE